MSSGELELLKPPPPVTYAPGPLGWGMRMLDLVDKLMVFLSMVALLAASSILTYSAVVRYFFKVPTDWQDETAVFMLIGVTFLCGAFVQAQRGHVGIQVLAGMLNPKWNGVRLILIDLLSTAFCAFFAWKSWTLLAEAVHEKQTTASTMAYPLWIPYSLMAVGMTLLSIRLLLQLLLRLFGPSPKPALATP